MSWGWIWMAEVTAFSYFWVYAHERSASIELLCRLIEWL